MTTIALPNVRIENDVRMNVSLKDNGVRVDWNSLTDIFAALYADKQRVLAGPCSVEIDPDDGETLIVRYGAGQPQYLGTQRIVVRCQYQGRKKTYDMPAFVFVSQTADLENEELEISDPEVDVELEVREVSTSLLDEAIDACIAATTKADAASRHQPKIDPDTNHWLVWNSTEGAYQDTGISAKGQRGPQGPQGPQGPAGLDGAVFITTDTPTSEWMPFVGIKDIILKYLFSYEDVEDYFYVRLVNHPEDSRIYEFGEVCDNRILLATYDSRERRWSSSVITPIDKSELTPLTFTIATPLDDVLEALSRNQPIVYEGFQALGYKEDREQLIFQIEETMIVFSWDAQLEEWSKDEESSFVNSADLYADYYDKTTIDGKLAQKANADLVPSQASSSNKLADKDFVNSSINALAAFYITSNASGDAFATKAALLAGPYYNGGVLRTPTKNDYAIVLADESKNNATTRYSYDGSVWAYQYKVNDTPLTAAQLAALNSGITSELVGRIGEKEITLIPSNSTFEEAKSLIEAAPTTNLIICKYQGVLGLYRSMDTGVIRFNLINSITPSLLVLSSDDTWTVTEYTYESVSNKENAITPNSTTKYPSSKAVADYVDEKIIATINEDY